jgi:hypothetical protein
MADLWEQIQRGEFPSTGATEREVICAVGRQLANRLDKLIDVIQRAPEGIVPIGAPGLAITPMGQLIALMRLVTASFPRDNQILPVTTVATPLITNPNIFDIPVLVTNLDNAQLLHYGGSAATTTVQSPIIDTETTEKILVSANRTLFGIVVGPGAINVGISNLDMPIV